MNGYILLPIHIYNLKHDEQRSKFINFSSVTSVSAEEMKFINYEKLLHTTEPHFQLPYKFILALFTGVICYIERMW